MRVTAVTPVDKRKCKVFTDEDFAFLLYNGELEAIGEKVNPVRFVAASDMGLTTSSNGISLEQNSSSDYLFLISFY